MDMVSLPFNVAFTIERHFVFPSLGLARIFCPLVRLLSIVRLTEERWTEDERGGKKRNGLILRGMRSDDIGSSLDGKIGDK